MAAILPAFAPATARAHHEALFGPQSSLAVEAQGFVSIQTHVHAYGRGGAHTTEATSIAHSYRSDAQTDRWRAGVGIIYAFDRATERVPPAFAPAEPSR